MFGQQALNLLSTQLQTATASVTPLPQVAVGWPPLEFLLTNVAQNKAISISIFDRGVAKDASRFMLYTANEFITSPGVTSVLSNGYLRGGASVTITLGGLLNTNDAVSFVAGTPQTTGVAVAEAGATDTLDTLAAALASAINSEIGGSIAASATNAVVTVTNSGTEQLRVASNVGNLGYRYTEVHREIRSVQVDVWAPTVALRETTAALVDQQLAYLDAYFGVQGVGPPTDDGTWIRVRHMGDQQIDTDVFKGLYRWMWHATIEHPQTYKESLYSVLAWLPSTTVSTTSGVLSGVTADSTTPTVDSNQAIT